MTVSETNTTIELYLKGEKESIYFIPKSSLLDSKNSAGKQVSDWIVQLLDKTWIEQNALYEVAQIIVREHPKNEIDWKSTFFIVEKKYYLDHVIQLKKQLNPSKDKSIFSSVLEAIDAGREETNEFTTNEISKIVSTRLQEYGII